MSYEISKEFAIPGDYIKKSKPRKYPFERMNIGDSFLIEEYSSSKMRSALSSAYAYRKIHNKPDFEVVARKTDDGGIRIWRIK